MSWIDERDERLHCGRMSFCRLLDVFDERWWVGVGDAW